MKVAMIGHKDFPSRSGGVEVMVGGLAASLVRRGYEVTVYNRGLQKGHNVYTTEGVQARRIFTFQKASLNAMVYSFLATFDALTRDYDVIHYHAIGAAGDRQAVRQAHGVHRARAELEGGQVGRLCQRLPEAG